MYKRQVHTIVEYFRTFEKFIPWIALILLGYIGAVSYTHLYTFLIIAALDRMDFSAALVAEE